MPLAPHATQSRRGAGDGQEGPRAVIPQMHVRTQPQSQRMPLGAAVWVAVEHGIAVVGVIRSMRTIPAGTAGASPSAVGTGTPIFSRG